MYWSIFRYIHSKSKKKLPGFKSKKKLKQIKRWAPWCSTNNGSKHWWCSSKRGANLRYYSWSLLFLKNYANPSKNVHSPLKTALTNYSQCNPNHRCSSCQQSVGLFFFFVHWSYLCHFHLLSTPIHANINYVLNCKCLFFNSRSVLDDKAGNLRFQSEVYKKDATYLNLRSSYAKYAAVGTVFLVLVIYVRFWWFWGTARLP